MCVKAVCDRAKVLTHSTSSSLHTNTLTQSAEEGKLCSEVKETGFVQRIRKPPENKPREHQAHSHSQKKFPKPTQQLKKEKGKVR